VTTVVDPLGLAPMSMLVNPLLTTASAVPLAVAGDDSNPLAASTAVTL
jgi:hypothetical protein